MFRIIHFRIDKRALIEASKTSESCVERVQKLGDLYSGPEAVFHTKMFSTSSAEYFELEQTLRSLFGDGSTGRTWARWCVVDCSHEYKMLRTRAPREYDYDYVIEIGQMEGEFGAERLVLVPKDRVEYQSGRYSSGMYTPVDCS